MPATSVVGVEDASINYGAQQQLNALIAPSTTEQLAAATSILNGSPLASYALNELSQRFYGKPYAELPWFDQWWIVNIQIWYGLGYTTQQIVNWFLLPSGAWSNTNVIERLQSAGWLSGSLTVPNSSVYATLDRPSGTSALGFTNEQAPRLPDDIALAYAMIVKAPPPPPVFQPRWTAWASGGGAYNRASGDSDTVTSRA